MIQERSAPVFFLVRIIGILLLAIGCLLFSTGAILHFTGDQAKNRYQSSAGEILRVFSRKDQTYYKYLRVAIWAGHVAKAASVFALVAGGCILWAPHLFFYSMMRVRQGQRICAQQESNLQPTD